MCKSPKVAAKRKTVGSWKKQLDHSWYTGLPLSAGIVVTQPCFPAEDKICRILKASQLLKLPFCEAFIVHESKNDVQLFIVENNGGKKTAPKMERNRSQSIGFVPKCSRTWTFLNIHVLHQLTSPKIWAANNFKWKRGQWCAPASPPLLLSAAGRLPKVAETAVVGSRQGGGKIQIGRRVA